MRGVRTRLSAALALALALGVPAWGNDTNYQNYLVGERALGLGGAYCALADDASGAFYNPAGVALVRSSSLSGSLNIYGIEKQRRERGYTAQLDGTEVTVDLEDTHVATLPTTVALVRKLGRPMSDGVSRHAVGYAIYMPYSTSFEMDEVVRGPRSEGEILINESDRTLWTGPFYAVRLNERFSLGATVHYGYRTVKRRLLRVWESENADGITSSFFSVESAAIDYTSGDAFARAGARYDVGGGLSLGLAATTPSAHLLGEGRLRSGTASAEIADPPDPSLAVYEVAEDGGLKTRNPEPVTLRAGVAWEGQRTLAALDVTAHLSEEFRPIELPAAQTASVGRLHVSEIERRRVVNVNVGGEHTFAGIVPVRAGFLTNFSSAPEVRASDRPQLSHVDMYGATMSV